VYLTYEEYLNMGGTLDETTFNDYYYQAKALIDYVTFNRLKNDTTFPIELKYCMFRLIKMYVQRNSLLNPNDDSASSGSSSGGVVSSYSNDGVSVSYNVVSADKLVDYTSDAESIKLVKQYLADVKNEAGRKVLYRGVYPNE